MRAKRVIPCLDVKDGRVVKGVNFVSLRDAGDPVELARAYDREGADEVVFLDTIPPKPDMNCPKIKYISVAHMFAEAISHIYMETSVSPLFT